MVVLVAWSLATAATVALCFWLLPMSCRERMSPCVRWLPYPCGPRKKKPEPERERVERVPAFAAGRPRPVERPVPVPYSRRLSRIAPTPDGRASSVGTSQSGSKEWIDQDGMFYFPAPPTRVQIVMDPEQVERQLSYASLFVTKQDGHPKRE